MKLIERVELIGNYKSKIEKATSRTYSGLSLRPVRVMTDVELLGGGKSVGRDDSSSGPRFPRFSPF